MKRLRRPVSAIREPFGTAGLILACVALIAALTGGAYAASGGLTSQQTKEVKKIAKKFAGKRGAAGPAGPQGSPGAVGGNGKDGLNGTNGVSGDNGKSVLAADEATGTSKCEGRGGASFEVEGSGTKHYACNGEEGSPWTAGGALPAGESEIGVYGGVSELNQFVALPISFNLAVEPAPEPIFVEGASEVGCPGIIAGVPTADPGKLCVYKGAEYGGLEAPAEPGFLKPDSPALEPGATPVGTLFGGGICAATACTWSGVWAVTAAL